MQTIKLPANKAAIDGVWVPRPHQAKGWEYLLSGGKRLVEVDHRRAGKDEMSLAWACVAAHNRIGTYWHMLPEAAQARKAIWTAVDEERGVRRIDLAFPPEIRKRTRDQDMFIEFKNGSTWQVVGSDNFNSLVGSPPVGLVYSEFALANPYAWSYLRPILRNNGGWAIFISTPRGRNTLYRLWKYALEQDNDWLSVFNRADETGVFTSEQLEQERREYINEYGEVMGTALFEQEYLCSWDAAVPGAYWGQELTQLERDGRFGNFPHNPSLPVIVSDDIGVNDTNVKLYWQVNGPQITLIDWDAWTGCGVQTHAKTMVEKGREKGYHYVQQIYPHDIKVREWGSDGQTRKATARKFIPCPITPAPDASGVKGIGLHEGIDIFRRLIPRLYVNENCREVLEMWKQYHAEYDDSNQTLRKQPHHDNSSNYADSARYFAITPWIKSADEWGADLDYSYLNKAIGQ